MTKPALDPTVPLSARDRETARLLAVGDAEGLRRLLNDHGTKVRAVLRRDFSRMLDNLEIDEAINQATVRVWRAGASFDQERGSLAAWFFVVARNCARRILETKVRLRAEPLSASLAAEDVAEAEAVADGATVRRAPPRWEVDLYRCIDALPPQQRAVMLLDLAAGGNAIGSEVARALGTSVNSVYVSRANGRRTIRLAMEALGHRVCGQAVTTAVPASAEPAADAALSADGHGQAESETAGPPPVKERRKQAKQVQKSREAREVREAPEEGLEA